MNYFDTNRKKHTHPLCIVVVKRHSSFNFDVTGIATKEGALGQDLMKTLTKNYCQC